MCFDEFGQVRLVNLRGGPCDLEVIQLNLQKGELSIILKQRVDQYSVGMAYTDVMIRFIGMGGDG